MNLHASSTTAIPQEYKSENFGSQSKDFLNSELIAYWRDEVIQGSQNSQRCICSSRMKGWCKVPVSSREHGQW